MVIEFIQQYQILKPTIYIRWASACYSRLEIAIITNFVGLDFSFDTLSPVFQIKEK